MRLRRLFAVLAAALALAGFTLAPAQAEPGPEKGTCSNLYAAGGNLVDSDGNNTFDHASGTASIPTAPCARISYVMDVYSPAGGTPVASASQPVIVAPQPDGSTTLTWLAPIPPPSGTYMCLTLESRDSRGRVIDRAPSTPTAGCAIGGAISGPPAGGWH